MNLGNPPSVGVGKKLQVRHHYSNHYLKLKGEPFTLPHTVGRIGSLDDTGSGIESARLVGGQQ